MRLFVLVISSLGFLYSVNNAYLHPEMNGRTLEIPRNLRSEFRDNGIRVAVIGDIHAGDTFTDYESLSNFLRSVLGSNPDLVLLLGDYTASPLSVSNMYSHRAEVAKRLSVLNSFPIAAVMGNYETLSNPAKWKDSFLDARIIVLQNDVAAIKVRGKGFCIRGFGDAYTNQFQFVDFPKECDKLSKITITHDPAGAFKKGVLGIIFAAHTHCGQIRLPLLGSIWMPTEAPREATCGLYEDQKRWLWVTAGVGASILPIRIGAQAQWDLLRLTGGENGRLISDEG